MVRPSTLTATIATIASAARDCAAFGAAYRLATWVGEGKRVTPRRVLRPVDVPAAALALGISTPARIRTASDVLALHRPWRLALTAGFLRIVDGHVRPGPTLARWPDPDDDTVCELWLTGVNTAFAGALPEADEAEEAAFVRAMVTVLASEPSPSPGDLWHGAREELTGEDTYAAYWFVTGWLRHDDPLAPLEPLIEFGAAVREGSDLRITPLGRWAFEQMQARAPKPITADLPAAQLIARLAAVEDGKRWGAAQTWLRGRDPLPAARDLLRAAATATPAQRVAAVHLVHSLDEPAEAAWDEAAAAPNLSAHARAVADEELSAQDSAWLAVEYAAAALSDPGPDEALSRLAEMVPGDGLEGRLRAVECAAHPVGFQKSA